MNKKDSIIFVSIVISVLAIIRIYFTWITGYFVPDEAVYYYIVYHYYEFGNIVFGYSVRLVIQSLIFVCSYILGLDNIREYLIVFPIITTIFSIGCLYYAKKTLDYLELESRYTILVFSFVPIYLLLSSIVLTEQIALFFVFFGSYYFIKEDYRISLFGYIGACLFREVYVVYLVGNFLFLLYRRNKNYLVYLCSIPIAIICSYPNTVYQFIGDILGLKYSKRGNVFIEVPNLFLGFRGIDPKLNIIGWIGNSIKNIFVGYVGGFGIILILMIIGIYYLYKYRKIEKYSYIRFQMLLSVVISLICITIKSQRQSYAISHVATIIRFVHPSVYSVMIVSFLFTYSYKYRKKIIVVCIVGSLIGVVPFLIGMQSELSNSDGNILDLKYRSSYTKVEKYLRNEDSSVLIWAEPIEGLIVWLSDYNFDIKIPIRTDSSIENYSCVERGIFINKSRLYDRVYLYGGVRGNHFLNLARVGWYLDIVAGKDDYFELIEIWSDDESYFYELRVIG